MNRIKATVICECKMRIKSSSVWGDDTTIKQITKQAKEGIPTTIAGLKEGLNGGTIEPFGMKETSVILEEESTSEGN